MASRAAVRHSRDLVVLVHGLLMPRGVTALLARRLRAQGFDALMFAYPSVRASMDAIVGRLERLVAAHYAPRVHFVGHSLGGLVILAMLFRYPARATGRVVLLGSPCTACSVATQLSQRSGWRPLLGQALPAWRLEQGVAVAGRVETGMIAGTGRIGLGRFLARLDTPNDGVVTVEETRMAGLADHLVMPVSHSTLLVSARVARQVATFLVHGRFDRASC